MMGWICPVCGAGNAPFAAQCPCESGASSGAEAAQLTAPSGANGSGSGGLAREVLGSKAVKTNPSTSKNKYEYPDPEFHRFWKVYPSSRGKSAAYRRWCGVMAAGIAPQTVIEAALAYRNDPNRDPLKTKYAEGWLNDGRWEDELDPVPAPRPSVEIQETDWDAYRAEEDAAIERLKREEERS